jgi:hypothetical protein
MRRLFTFLALAIITASAAIAGTPANAAPQYYKITVLNGGKVLAVDLSGGVVVTEPHSGTAAQWELVFPGSAGSSEPGFGSAFQLRNRATQKCVQDVGNNIQLAEVNCLTSPAPKSTQPWQQHTSPDRTVNGKDYVFLFNRFTTRVVSRAPEFGNTVPALSSTKASNTGSAAAALQLWHLERL